MNFYERRSSALADKPRDALAQYAVFTFQIRAYATVKWSWIVFPVAHGSSSQFCTGFIARFILILRTSSPPRPPPYPIQIQLFKGFPNQIQLQHIPAKVNRAVKVSTFNIYDCTVLCYRKKTLSWLVRKARSLAKIH